MSVLIIGGGSAGRRHARIASGLGFGPVTLVSGSAPADAADIVVSALESVEANDFNFAIVASPATAHVDHLKELAIRDIPILIEKPLSYDSASAEALLGDSEIIDRVRVAYNLRFDSGFSALRNLIEKEVLGRPLRYLVHAGQDIRLWRTGRDYRETVSARRALGGGVLLELSHEFDYLCCLAGTPTTVSGRTEKISQLDLDVEDTADLDIAFDSGLRASIHLNMVQYPFRRCCEVIFSEGTAVWDLIGRSVRYCGSDGGDWHCHWDGSSESPELSYERQMLAFADEFGIQGSHGQSDQRFPLATVSDAFGVLQIVDTCRRSSREGRREISLRSGS